MYAYVSPGGAISFRYYYRFNGRRETLKLGRYERGGLSLAQARERLFEIRRTIADGVSPALEKQRAKRRLKEAHSFEHVAQRWMDTAPMTDSTRNKRRSIFNLEVLQKWRTRLLSEITPDDLRAALQVDLRSRGARDRPSLTGHRQADLRLGHFAWREDRQSGGRRRPGVHRHLPAPVSQPFAQRNPDYAQPAWRRRDLADHPAQHGAKERAPGRDLGRDGFLERRLVHPQGAHKAVVTAIRGGGKAQGLPLEPFTVHDLRRTCALRR